ncbi:helix-turn-helix domain-containing protein [Rhizobium sp. LjRoot30]|uniref:helix-turn-helix domain-containing protein n=1 Tax=Rhizobium sp. LjRoot30 TaxID=3342320 RepID=UPI003ECE9DAE
MLHVGWSHRTEAPARIMVYPDGCRDVIIAEPPDRAPYILFSDWDFQPRAVDVIAGTRMTGFRLRPGLTLTPAALAELTGQETKIATFLESMLSPTDELADVIALLAGSTMPLARIARHAGVSSRTLQRRLRECQMPSPDYWRRLGRARRTVSALSGSETLADTAARFGYSDQAHMSRECKSWFGRSPAQLRRDPGTRAILAQPGVGNWTGEQISIR